MSCVIFAFDQNGIPDHVRSQLDQFIQMRQQWEAMWNEMTKNQQNHFMRILDERSAMLDEINWEQVNNIMQRIWKDVEHVNMILEDLPREYIDSVHDKIIAHIDGLFEETESVSILNFNELSSIFKIIIQCRKEKLIFHQFPRYQPSPRTLKSKVENPTR